MEQVRELVFYRHYFHEFFDRQSEKVKGKIDYVLFLMTHAERVPEKFLMHLEGQKGLYEIRVEVGSNIYRIFCCFDKGKIVCCSTDSRKRPRKHQKQKLNLRLV